MKILAITLLSSTLLLVACSDKNTYQQQAQQTPALTMPPNVTLNKSDPYYPIPKSINTTHTKQPSLIPPNSHLSTDTQQAKS